MRYCADTWFILAVFAKEAHAIALIEETKRGKTRIIIPVIVYAEATKKLMQKGIPLDIIEEFFEGVEASEKIELVLIDKLIAQEAAKVSLTFHVPLIDSLVASTTKLTGYDVLLSGDTDYENLVKRKYLKVFSW